MSAETLTMLDTPVFQYLVIPLLIFLARVCDVSIGTVRLILLYRGRRVLAPLLGFFEVLIWLLAVRQIMFNLTNPLFFISFAAGFAMGNYVGILLEEKLAVGLEIIRIITKNNASELINSLAVHGYGTTSIDATGSTGRVSIIFTIVPRKHHRRVIKIINQFNPKAFYTVEDVKTVSEGIFPVRYHVPAKKL